MTLNGVEVTLFVGIVSSLWSVVFFKTGEAFVKFLQLWKLKANEVSPIDSDVVQVEFKEEIEVGEG